MGDHIHMTAVLYRGSLRPATTGDGRDTRHSFSFGGHYDPTSTGFAALVAHNDERLGPGAGYAEHRHRDVEIVTYVVDGVLAHRGAGVTTDRLGPRDVMVTSAGSGGAALHVFVATGSGRCADLALDEGDALRVPEPAALRFTAASGPGAGALLLVWSFRPTLTRGRAALPAAPR